MLICLNLNQLHLKMTVYQSVVASYGNRCQVIFNLPPPFNPLSLTYRSEVEGIIVARHIDAVFSGISKLSVNCDFNYLFIYSFMYI